MSTKVRTPPSWVHPTDHNASDSSMSDYDGGDDDGGGGGYQMTVSMLLGDDTIQQHKKEQLYATTKQNKSKQQQQQKLNDDMNSSKLLHESLSRWIAIHDENNDDSKETTKATINSKLKENDDDDLLFEQNDRIKTSTGQLESKSVLQPQQPPASPTKRRAARRYYITTSSNNNNAAATNNSTTTTTKLPRRTRSMDTDDFNMIQNAMSKNVEPTSTTMITGTTTTTTTNDRKHTTTSPIRRRRAPRRSRSFDDTTILALTGRQNHDSLIFSKSSSTTKTDDINSTTTRVMTTSELIRNGESVRSIVYCQQHDDDDDDDKNDITPNQKADISLLQHQPPPIVPTINPYGRSNVNNDDDDHSTSTEESGFRSVDMNFNLDDYDVDDDDVLLLHDPTVETNDITNNNNNNDLPVIVLMDEKHNSLNGGHENHIEEDSGLLMNSNSIDCLAMMHLIDDNSNDDSIDKNSEVNIDNINTSDDIADPINNNMILTTGTPNTTRGTVNRVTKHPRRPTSNDDTNDDSGDHISSDEDRDTMAYSDSSDNYFGSSMESIFIRMKEQYGNRIITNDTNHNHNNNNNGSSNDTLFIPSTTDITNPTLIVGDDKQMSPNIAASLEQSLRRWASIDDDDDDDDVDEENNKESTNTITIETEVINSQMKKPPTPTISLSMRRSLIKRGESVRGLIVPGGNSSSNKSLLSLSSVPEKKSITDIKTNIPSAIIITSSNSDDEAKGEMVNDENEVEANVLDHTTISQSQLQPPEQYPNMEIKEIIIDRNPHQSTTAEDNCIAMLEQERPHSISAIECNADEIGFQSVTSIQINFDETDDEKDDSVPCDIILPICTTEATNEEIITDVMASESIEHPGITNENEDDCTRAISEYPSMTSPTTAISIPSIITTATINPTTLVVENDEVPQNIAQSLGQSLRRWASIDDEEEENDKENTTNTTTGTEAEPTNSILKKPPTPTTSLSMRRNLIKRGESVRGLIVPGGSSSKSLLSLSSIPETTRVIDVETDKPPSSVATSSSDQMNRLVNSTKIESNEIDMNSTTIALPEVSVDVADDECNTLSNSTEDKTKFDCNMNQLIITEDEYVSKREAERISTFERSTYEEGFQSVTSIHISNDKTDDENINVVPFDNLQPTYTTATKNENICTGVSDSEQIQHSENSNENRKDNKGVFSEHLSTVVLPGEDQNKMETFPSETGKIARNAVKTQLSLDSKTASLPDSCKMSRNEIFPQKSLGRESSLSSAAPSSPIKSTASMMRRNLIKRGKSVRGLSLVSKVSQQTSSTTSPPANEARKLEGIATTMETKEGNLVQINEINIVSTILDGDCVSLSCIENHIELTEECEDPSKAPSLGEFTATDDIEAVTTTKQIRSKIEDVPTGQRLLSTQLSFDSRSRLQKQRAMSDRNLFPQKSLGREGSNSGSQPNNFAAVVLRRKLIKRGESVRGLGLVSTMSKQLTSLKEDVEASNEDEKYVEEETTHSTKGSDSMLIERSAIKEVEPQLDPMVDSKSSNEDNFFPTNSAVAVQPVDNRDRLVVLPTDQVSRLVPAMSNDDKVEVELQQPRVDSIQPIRAQLSFDSRNSETISHATASTNLFPQRSFGRGSITNSPAVTSSALAKRRNLIQRGESVRGLVVPIMTPLHVPSTSENSRNMLQAKLDSHSDNTCDETSMNEVVCKISSEFVQVGVSKLNHDQESATIMHTTGPDSVQPCASDQFEISASKQQYTTLKSPLENVQGEVVKPLNEMQTQPKLIECVPVHDQIQSIEESAEKVFVNQQYGIYRRKLMSHMIAPGICNNREEKSIIISENSCHNSTMEKDQVHLNDRTADIRFTDEQSKEIVRFTNETRPTSPSLHKSDLLDDIEKDNTTTEVSTHHDSGTVLTSFSDLMASLSMAADMLLFSDYSNPHQSRSNDIASAGNLSQPFDFTYENDGDFDDSYGTNELTSDIINAHDSITIWGEDVYLETPIEMIQPISHVVVPVMISQSPQQNESDNHNTNNAKEESGSTSLQNTMNVTSDLDKSSRSNGSMYSFPKLRKKLSGKLTTVASPCNDNGSTSESHHTDQKSRSNRKLFLLPKLHKKTSGQIVSSPSCDNDSFNGSLQESTQNAQSSIISSSPSTGKQRLKLFSSSSRVNTSSSACCSNVATPTTTTMSKSNRGGGTNRSMRLLVPSSFRKRNSISSLSSSPMKPTNNGIRMNSIVTTTTTPETLDEKNVYESSFTTDGLVAISSLSSKLEILQQHEAHDNEQHLDQVPSIIEHNHDDSYQSSHRFNSTNILYEDYEESSTLLEL